MAVVVNVEHDHSVAQALQPSPQALPALHLVPRTDPSLTLSDVVGQVGAKVADRTLLAADAEHRDGDLALGQADCLGDPARPGPAVGDAAASRRCGDSDSPGVVQWCAVLEAARGFDSVHHSGVGQAAVQGVQVGYKVTD